MTRNSILQLFSVVFDDMDDDLKDFQPLKVIASKIHIQHSKIFFLGIILTLIITFVDYFAFTFVSIFGLIYPAYMTFQVVQEKNVQKQKKWLTYWIIYSVTTLLDSLFVFLLFFLPSFYTCKALLYLWLFYPKSDGAQKLYTYIVKPYILNIKETVQKLQKQTSK